MRELSIPQIQTALRACDRRDAMLGLQRLETTHAAVAPLMVGRSGKESFDKCVATLRQVITPKQSDSVFKRMLAMAKRSGGQKKPPTDQAPAK